MRHLTVLVFMGFFALKTFSAETTAICPLKANGVTDSEAASLTDTLRSELSKLSRYNLMDRSRMDEMVKAQGSRQPGPCFDSGCAIEIGNLLSVKYVVFGSVSKTGDVYTLNLRMVDVPAGMLVKHITEHHKLQPPTPPVPPAPARVVMYTAPVIPESPLPSKKTDHSWIWWTSGGVVVAAIVAVPVAYFFFHSNKTTSNPTMEFDASW